jgi:hypothetical protein
MEICRIGRSPSSEYLKFSSLKCDTTVDTKQFRGIHYLQLQGGRFYPTADDNRFLQNINTFLCGVIPEDYNPKDR